MATLSKHGNYIKVESTLSSRAYCADGHVLKNYGFGWKLWRKLKKDIDYKQAADKHIKRQAENLKASPTIAHFCKLFKSLVPSLKKRALVFTVIELMPDDPDGVWSECDIHWETQGDLSFDDCNQLCKAYKAYTS